MNNTKILIIEDETIVALDIKRIVKSLDTKLLILLQISKVQLIVLKKIDQILY